MFGRILELIKRLFRFEPDDDILDDLEERDYGQVIHYLKPGQKLNDGKSSAACLDNPKNATTRITGKNKNK